MNEHTKHVVDAASIGTVLASIVGWLPAVAAALSIAWTLIRIYETRTVQRVLAKICPKRVLNQEGKK